MIKVLNEEKHAQYMLEKKKFLLKRSMSYELRILAKHYIYNEGLNRPKTREKLIEFCKEDSDKFDEIQCRNIINNAVEGAKKYGFVNIEGINITQKELDKIKTLNNIRHERVAFIMLIISKFNNYVYNFKHQDKESEYYLVFDKLSDIFKLAKVSGKQEDRIKIMKRLIDEGFIYMSTACNYKVLFIDEEGEGIIELDDIREFVLLYEKYVGCKVIKCKECGQLVRQKNNRTKYCDECKKEIKNKQNLKSWHKNKDKYEN
ncbi:hypothetical protein [Clostridium cylindrosporum]|uniref:Uncharacterized protein n=1 Tax=Clostridium cylindrosporum DSM 605 TaxID=1121307 RepID=A0A0J8D5X9_CLOCY|nr:hypothetical protein [Clostridium cylindrosporum]KMT21500.1 hypothetical protein CLCY_2c02610 [Clostridium cylindrosporum DSM 605]